MFKMTFKKTFEMTFDMTFKSYALVYFSVTKLLIVADFLIHFDSYSQLAMFKGNSQWHLGAHDLNSSRK